MNQPTKWHGLSDHFAFLKATVSLGSVIAGLLWGVFVYAVDFRTEDLREAVASNSNAIQRIEVKVDSLLKANLLKSILDVRKLQCTAQSSEVKHYAQEELVELSEQYREEFRTAPLIPGCDDF